MSKKEMKKVENVADITSFKDERFLKFPTFLLTQPKFAGKKLSNDAKVLYLLFRNSFAASIMHNLRDANGIYINYTISKMVETLGKSRPTCIKAKNELKQVGLIEDNGDNNHDPRTGKKEPNKYYLLNIDYWIGDIQGLKNSTLANETATAKCKGQHEKDGISNNSASTKNEKNLQNSESYPSNCVTNFESVEDKKANERSLDAMAPLKKDEDSQTSEPYKDNKIKNIVPVQNKEKNTENIANPAYLQNEDFNKQASTQQNQQSKEYLHNINKKIDQLHNKNSYSKSSFVTSKDDKDSKADLNKMLNQNIANTIKNGMSDYQAKHNKLSVKDIDLLANWLKDLHQTKEYCRHINAAIDQGINESSQSGKEFFSNNSERVLSAVSGLLVWCIDKIEHPEKAKYKIRNSNNFIFNTVKKKVKEVLDDPQKLNYIPNEHSNKYVEKGTDWSKKKVDTNSGYSTEKLRDLFKDLNNA